MPGIAAAPIGVSPSSNSQHANSKKAAQRSRAASASTSIGRTASSDVAQGSSATSRGANGGGRASTCEASLPFQQLQEALKLQAKAEESRQRHLTAFRRHVRAYCDENSILRNILQGGEGRKREAERALHTEALEAGFRVLGAGTKSGSASVTEAELELLKQRINLARQRENVVAHELQANTDALEKEEHARETLRKEAEVRLDPEALLLGANRPVYLRMMRLEHLLNDVLRQQSTVSVVVTNYRYHLNLLRDEAAQYDAQQTTLEEEYRERHRDHGQLIGLYDDACNAYAAAVESGAALQTSAATVRQVKEKALQHKRHDVESAVAGGERLERTLMDLQQQLDEESQQLEAAANTKAQLQFQRMNSAAALTLLKAAGANGGDAGQQTENADERISAYEVAFQEMMHVANVDSLDALVAKYQKEMEQQCNLQDDLEELRETRTILTEQLQVLQERWKQSKYCVGARTRLRLRSPSLQEEGLQKKTAADGALVASSTTAASPLLEREAATFLREETATLSSHVRTNATTQALLMDVATRVNRLATLVADYRPEVRLLTVRLSPAIARRSSTLPLHTAVLAQKLLALAADAVRKNTRPVASGGVVMNSGKPNLSLSGKEGAVVTEDTPSAAVAVVSSTQLMIPANNRRVHVAAPRGTEVAAMSSAAARALLHSASTGGNGGGGILAGPNSSNPNNNNNNSGLNVGAMRRGRRASSASDGAGFIPGQDADADDAQLATVAALPGPGGRVLRHLDNESSDDSFGRDGDSARGEDSAQFGGDRGASDSTMGGGGGNAASLSGSGVGRPPYQQRRRRSSTFGAVHAAGRGGAGAADEAQDEPLDRAEVKRMATRVQERWERETGVAKGKPT